LYSGVIVYTTGQFAEVPEGFGGSNTSSCQWLPELNVYTDGFGGVERTKWQGLAGGSGSWYVVLESVVTNETLGDATPILHRLQDVTVAQELALL
jgi:hypothetical protein